MVTRSSECMQSEFVCYDLARNPEEQIIDKLTTLHNNTGLLTLNSISSCAKNTKNFNTFINKRPKTHFPGLLNQDYSKHSRARGKHPELLVLAPTTSNQRQEE